MGDSTASVSPDEDLRYFRPVGIYGILQLIAITLKTGVQKGYWIYVFRMAGLISIALGVTNLLPLPALDGGRILFVVLDWLSEKILRRKINPEKEILVHAIGIMVLLLFMVVITWQDIVNPLIQFPPSTPTP
jgi:regulator of sigma E protease